VYPEDARYSPPDDLNDWDTYVRAVVDRYKGRIQAYELWVFGNEQRMYSGSTETLVEMTRRAGAIVRAVDPRATVVCPGMGNLWTHQGRQILRRFAELGGYDHCDVAGVKLHQSTAGDPPERMLELIALVDRIFKEVGVHPRLWNTGTMYDITQQSPLERTKATNYAVRFFLVGLLARASSLERMYFYNWGGTHLPIVLQPAAGEPTAAALAVATLQRWIAEAEIRSCGHGRAAALPDNAWQCEFTVDTANGPRRAAIRWTHEGTATTQAESAATVLHLDDTSRPVAPGAVITLTEEPVLVRYDG
jgi:hypothetical protein